MEWPIISKEELFMIGRYQIEGILRCENCDALAFIYVAVTVVSDWHLLRSVHRSYAQLRSKFRSCAQPRRRIGSARNCDALVKKVATWVDQVMEYGTHVVDRVI